MIAFLAKIYPLILLSLCVLAVPLSVYIKKHEEENTFRMTRIPMMVGVVCGVFMAIILFAISFSDAGAGEYMALAVMSLLPLALISSYFTFHIAYDKDGFTHRNAIGIERRYRYTDVTEISDETEEGDITIYADGHKIRIDGGENPIKKNKFLSLIRAQYRRNNPCKTLLRKRSKSENHINGDSKQ